MLRKGSKAKRRIWDHYLEWRDPLSSEKMCFSLFPIPLLGRRVENSSQELTRRITWLKLRQQSTTYTREIHSSQLPSASTVMATSGTRSMTTIIGRRSARTLISFVL